MTALMKAALVVLGVSGAVFLLLSISLAVALMTGLWVGHGQPLPGGYTVPGLASVLGLLLGAVMAGVAALEGRWGAS